MEVYLLKHQLIGVSWMIDQDRKSEYKGDIIADDMGLGKTITIIAAIAKTRDEARSFGASALQDSDAESDDEPQLLGDTVNRRTAAQNHCTLPVHALQSAPTALGASAY